MTDKEEEAVAMEVDAAPDAAAAAPAAAEQEAEPSGTAEATTEDTPAGPSAEPEMVRPLCLDRKESCSTANSPDCSASSTLSLNNHPVLQCRPW